MNDRTFYKLAQDGIRIARMETRRAPPWPDLAAGWREALDDRDRALLTRPDRIISFQGQLEWKPRVRLISDRRTLQANGRDRVRVRIIGAQGDVPVRVGGQRGKVRAEEGIEVESNVTGVVRVEVDSPYVLSEPIFLVAEEPDAVPRS